MKIEIDNKLLATAVASATLASLLTAGSMHMAEKSVIDPERYSGSIPSGSIPSGQEQGRLIAPVARSGADTCADPAVMGYMKNGEIVSCPLPLLPPRYDNTNYDMLTRQARWAVKEYGRMLLTYELGNDAKLGDRELVISVLTRRLNHESTKHPSWTSLQIMEAVAKKWNPNKDKNLNQIQARTRNERTCKSRCEMTNEAAVHNLLAGSLATKVGRAAWKGKYTDFAHLDKAPSYYKRLASSKYHPMGSELRYRVWTGHNEAYFQGGTYY